MIENHMLDPDISHFDWPDESDDGEEERQQKLDDLTDEEFYLLEESYFLAMQSAEDENE